MRGVGDRFGDRVLASTERKRAAALPTSSAADSEAALPAVMAAAPRTAPVLAAAFNA